MVSGEHSWRNRGGLWRRRLQATGERGGTGQQGREGWPLHHREQTAGATETMPASTQRPRLGGRWRLSARRHGGSVGREGPLHQSDGVLAPLHWEVTANKDVVCQVPTWWGLRRWPLWPPRLPSAATWS